MTVGELRERLAEYPDFCRVAVGDPALEKADIHEEYPEDLEIETVRARAGAEVQIEVDLISRLDPRAQSRLRKAGGRWAR